MKEPYEKERDRFYKEVEDFWIDPGRRYPKLLAEPLYIDPEKWGPDPDGGKVDDAQHRYRKDIRGEVERRWAPAEIKKGTRRSEHARSGF
jgi:hypothetical protein